MPTLPPARTTTLKLVGSSVALTSPKFPAPLVFVEPVLKNRQFLPPVSVFSKNMDVPFVKDVERCSFPLGLAVPTPTSPLAEISIELVGAPGRMRKGKREPPVTSRTKKLASLPAMSQV